MHCHKFSIFFQFGHINRKALIEIVRQPSQAIHFLLYLIFLPFHTVLAPQLHKFHAQVLIEKLAVNW